MEIYNLKFTYKHEYPMASDHEFNLVHNNMMCKILNDYPIEDDMAKVEFSDGKCGDVLLDELEEI